MADVFDKAARSAVLQKVRGIISNAELDMIFGEMPSGRIDDYGNRKKYDGELSI